MAKKLDAFELETILLSLEKYYYEVQDTRPELTATLEHIDELGKEFHERAVKARKGWGVSVNTRWDSAWG